MLGGTLREGRRAAGVHLRFLSSIVFVIGFSSAAWGQVAVIGGPFGPPLALPTVTTQDDLKFASGLQLAQVGTIGGPTGPAITPPPVETGRPSEFAAPGRERTALTIEDWQIHPTAFGGFFFDTNPAQSSSAKSSFGLRAVPSFLAERADGIHKTSLYGLADARYFFSNVSTLGNNDIQAKAGVVEIYQPLEDLILNGQFDFTRQKDLFALFGIDHNLTPLNPTGVGLSPTTNPVSYNQLTANASVQKNFSDGFVIGSGSVLDIMYDRSSVPSPSPDGKIYTGSLRGGYWIVPVLYGYAEGAVDRRDYATHSLRSSGYHVNAGLGSDQVGLFKGEAYVGYQSEIGDSPAFGTVSGVAFGGQLHYYPLPELTIDTAFGRTIGVSLLANTAGSVGTSTIVTSIVEQTTYQLAQEWNVLGRAGFIHTDYTGNVRQDNAWTAGATVTYNLTQNLGITLDFQHITLSSNIPLQSFDRDVITLGATYKY
jgi:hypothetical protein